MPLAEIFLSHSSGDRAFATRLATALRGHGLSVWFSRDRIHGARQWHDAIGAALGRCGWFLLVLSPDSVRSQWVKRELMFALNDRRYVERIVPIVLRKCAVKRLSWTLDALQRVPPEGVFASDFDGNVDRLLRIWGQEPDRRRRRSRRHA